MNKIDRLPKVTTIETDYALWCAEQGALLRAGRLDAIDRENLAEEIESLGRSQEDEIENRLGVLLMHLLKWQFQPERRSNSWRATIEEQRYRIARRLRQNPSLRDFPATVLNDEYSLSRLKASAETGLGEDSFPAACPYELRDILAADWYPDAN